jgi:hypothetical protein
MRAAITEAVMTLNFGSSESNRRKGIREAERMDPRET